MEMNPSISLIAYSEEDAGYRSHWVKSPFMKGITALRSATLKALRLCSIFSASCLNCSLSKMPQMPASQQIKKQERQRLGSCSTEPALPVEALLLEDLPGVPSLAPLTELSISVWPIQAQPHRTAQSLPVLRGPVKAEGRGCRHRAPFSSYFFGHASRAPARR